MVGHNRFQDINVCLNRINLIDNRIDIADR